MIQDMHHQSLSEQGDQNHPLLYSFEYPEVLYEDIFLIPPFEKPKTFDELCFLSGMEEHKVKKIISDFWNLNQGIHWEEKKEPKIVINVSFEFENQDSWLYQEDLFLKAKDLFSTRTSVVFVAREPSRAYSAALYFRLETKRNHFFYKK